MTSRIKRSVGLLVMAAASVVCGLAQEPGPRSHAQATFLDTLVPEFQLRNQSLADGLWKLAKSPAPFAFGFEQVLKKRLADRDPVEPRLNLDLKNKTVRELLDAMCKADGRFTWSADGVTVNVFPRAVAANNSYLLNRKLKTLELKNATDVQDGLLAIVRQLPPPAEQVANAQLGGDDPYPREPWTVTYQNLTVREVVNRLAAHGGPCGTWIFGGAEDFRSFGFFNTNLRCPERRLPDPKQLVVATTRDAPEGSPESNPQR